MNIWVFVVSARKPYSSKEMRLAASLANDFNAAYDGALQEAKDNMPESEGWQEHAVVIKIKIPDRWLGIIAEEYDSIPSVFYEDD